MFPPSPALSTCDSLDGIDDLDAYLASQGSLSHFPTPPLRKSPITQHFEAFPQKSAQEKCDSPDYSYIAAALAEEASVDLDCSPEDIELVQGAILRADLPLELLALAFNILSGLHTRFFGLGSFTDCPPQLLVVAALNLAVSYTNDNPWSLSWWSRHVCDCMWTARRIDKTVLKLFMFLDYHLHEYSSCETIERTMVALSRLPEPKQYTSEAQALFTMWPSTPPDKPLSLMVDHMAPAYWGNGPLTPEATPPSSAHPTMVNLRTPLTKFLPFV